MGREHMKVSRRTAWLGGILLYVVAGAMLPAVVNGQTSVRGYRYEVLTRSQDFAYLSEVAPDIQERHVLVETDAQGRIVRTSVVRNGQKISTRVYSYSADAKAASEYDTFLGGEKTGHVRIQRNANGYRSREDYFGATGALTTYTLYTYRPDSVEAVSHAADGRKRSTFVSSYSASNILVREISYSNPDDPSFHVVTDFDDRTGLRTGTAQFEDGALSTTGVFTYSDGGELQRQDMYDASGDWFAGAELVDGLMARRFYDSSKELRYVYDERRRLKETTLFFGNRLVCRFTYERLPNGSIKRTLAHGADGSLWAEYPDIEVLDVRQNGSPINGRPAIIKKRGDWY
jgi:hypothetical protein